MKLCFATHNEHKLHEVRQFLGAKFDIVGLSDIGCHEEIPETGTTLDENSRIKAVFVNEKYGIDCFADDTGLEVEALNGEPGVYSARYAGEYKNGEANMNLLLNKLASQKNRKAQFRTVITLLQNDKELQFEGIVKGTILESLRGKKGFGYDPIFMPDGYNTTFAEMDLSEKNSISHRALAMGKLMEFLQSS